MQVRKLPVAQGLAWFKAALDLGARNPKAIFGAALLFIATIYIGLGVLIGAGELARMAGGVGVAAVVLNLLFLAAFVAVPILVGGLMHVIREAEAARPVRPRDLFAPFRSPRVRSLAGLGMLQIVASMVVGMVLVAVTGPSFWQETILALQRAAAGAPLVMPASDKFWLLVLIYLALNYIMYAVMLFAVPLVLFSNQGVLPAIRDAFKASLQNIGANLVAALLFIAGTLAAGVIALLMASLLAAVGGLVHPLLGVLLGMIPSIAFTTTMLVVLAGGAYIAWRDTFDGAPPSTPRPFGGIEA